MSFCIVLYQFVLLFLSSRENAPNPYKEGKIDFCSKMLPGK